MSPIDPILNRRSIRQYQPKEIPEEIMSQILEAARQAPSAANKQPIHFIIVRNRGLANRFSSLPFNDFVKDAPAVIVGCADTKSLLTGRWAVIDATIAMQNMVIAAWTLGIGSCWIGAFDEKSVKESLKVPDRWKVVALLTLGYPAEEPKPRKRKSFEELFSFDIF